MTRPRFRTGLLVGLFAFGLTVVPSARSTQPPSGTWMALGSTLAARNGAAAAVLANGRVLVTGGRTSSGVTSSAELFDVSTGLASPLPDMPTPRANHTATTLADGRVLVAGGITQDAAPIATAAADIFDPFTQTWTTVWMSAARGHHTASPLPDGRVLVAGGDSFDVPTSSVEIFDPSTATFTSAAPLGVARTRHAAAVRLDGTVIIAGGLGAAGVLASTEIVDPASGITAPGPSMGTARARFTATTLINGDVLVVGGWDGQADLASAERLGAGATAFIGWGSLATSRSSHVAVQLPENGGVLIAGGGTAAAPLASAELFLPKSGIIVATGSMTTGHVGATAGPLLSPGAVFVAGGYATGIVDSYGYATLKTDRDDYAPGETVTITGSGWVPGETVTLLLEEAPLLHGGRTLTAVADNQGRIVNTDFAPEQHHLGVRFYLTAYGSESEAQWTFTDSNPQALSVANPTSVTVNQGSTATFGTLTLSATGNTNACNTTLSVTAGFPSNATPQFGANPLTTTGSGVSTTFSVATTATTPIGTHTFQVTGINSVPAGGQCQGGNPTPSNVLTLVVTASDKDTTTAVSNATATYGDSTTTLTASVSASSTVDVGTVTFTVKNGATIIGTATTSGTVTGGAASVSYPLPAGTAAGTYTIEAAYSGGVGFKPGTGTGTLTIDPRPVTVTADSGQAKVYGEADPAAFTYQITSGTLVSGDAFTGALTRASGENVGLYAIQQGTLTLGTNYALSFVGADFEITARPVTVTADPGQTKVYGEADPAAFTYQITSGTLVSGDAFTGALTRASGENVGLYAIQQGTLTLGTNYALSFVGANFEITARPVTVTADSGQAKVYGEADPAAFTYQITSGTLVSGDAFTGALTRASGENVGLYAIQQGTLTLGPNYALSFIGASFSITPRAITVTADNRTKIVGAVVTFAGTEFTITAGSLAAGDVIGSVSLTSPGSPAAAAAGTYPIIPSAAVFSAGSAANYTITYENGTLTVIFGVCVQFDQSKSHKKGSTIPVKLNLCDVAGANVSSPGDVVSATMLVRVSAGTSPFLAEDSGDANPDNNFRLTGGSYLFNLSTKSPGFNEGQWMLSFTVNGVGHPSYAVTFFIK